MSSADWRTLVVIKQGGVLDLCRELSRKFPSTLLIKPHTALVCVCPPQILNFSGLTVIPFSLTGIPSIRHEVSQRREHPQSYIGSSPTFSSCDKVRSMMVMLELGLAEHWGLAVTKLGPFSWAQPPQLPMCYMIIFSFDWSVNLNSFTNSYIFFAFFSNRMLTSEIVCGLQYLHIKGIMHR